MIYPITPTHRLRRRRAKWSLAPRFRRRASGLGGENCDVRRRSWLTGRGGRRNAGPAFEKQEIAVRVVPSDAVTTENIFRLDVTDVDMVCLSYLEAGGFRTPAILCGVCDVDCRTPNSCRFLDFDQRGPENRNALRESGADRVLTSLRQAAEQVTMAKEFPSRRNAWAKRYSDTFGSGMRPKVLAPTRTSRASLTDM
jgi:hypothetical protein